MISNAVGLIRESVSVRNAVSPAGSGGRLYGSAASTWIVVDAAVIAATRVH